MLPAKPLPLGNDYLIRVYLTEFDADTNSYIPATGLVDVLATFTRDAAGTTPIALDLTDIALTELSVSADPDNEGWYSATVPAADLDADLNNVEYLNGLVYRVIRVGDPVEATFVQPLRVVLP